MRLTNDIFHVSLLKIYIVDQTHIIDWNNVQVESEGYFHVEPLSILNMREVVLWKQTIMQVEVQWEHYTLDEATQEREDVMRKAYPFLQQKL